MDIVSKLVEIENNGEINNDFIESKLNEMGIIPLRWAIVNVDCNKLTLSVAHQNL